MTSLLLALILAGCVSPAAIPLPEPRQHQESAIAGGTATWCAPTPTHCQGWGRPAMLGAMESFRWGDEPYPVEVRHGDRSVVVTVVSHCACPSTLIDLSVAAFEQLAPLSRGRIDVTVTDAGPSVTPPTTDTTDTATDTRRLP